MPDRNPTKVIFANDWQKCKSFFLIFNFVPAVPVLKRKVLSAKFCFLIYNFLSYFYKAMDLSSTALVAVALVYAHNNNESELSF